MLLPCKEIFTLIYLLQFHYFKGNSGGNYQQTEDGVRTTRDPGPDSGSFKAPPTLQYGFKPLTTQSLEPATLIYQVNLDIILLHIEKNDSQTTQLFSNIISQKNWFYFFKDLLYFCSIE